VSSIIVFYVVIVIIVDFFTIKSWFDKTTEPQPTFSFAIFDTNIFSSYCLSLFSVVNQFSIINIISELKKPTNKRISKVVGRSSIFPLMIYLTIGIIGYATYGSATPDIIVQRTKKPDTSDILMTIGR